MTNNLKTKAEQLINVLQSIDEVKGCKIYGSLAKGTSDELSDIDIEIDVSGVDNGKFLLSLVEKLKDKIKIYYSDYAPSLIPQRYLVSIALDEKNPFLIADLACEAKPHFSTVSKETVEKLNNKYTHILKLWTANLKHLSRKGDCFNDIVRMSKKLGIEGENLLELLEKTLVWLENNVTKDLKTFISSCRDKFEELSQSVGLKI